MIFSQFDMVASIGIEIGAISTTELTGIDLNLQFAVGLISYD